MSSAPALDILVLDAAPLLSLSPLRGLAKIYMTTPQVLAELRDPRAREHFQKLGTEGVDVLVRTPDVLSYSKVTAAAKKSGDFAVLSQTDMMLLALTVSMVEEHKKTSESTSSSEPALQSQPIVSEETTEEPEVVHDLTDSESEPADETEDQTEEPSADPTTEESDSLLDPGPLHQDSAPIPLPDLSTLALSPPPPPPSEPTPSTQTEPAQPVFEDPPSEDDDGEGEWITPDNVAKFKAREIFPEAQGKAAHKPEHLGVACMTADYAMQNVLLHMGLNLVGLEGKRITMVKTWVLRCHACYKLCKDQTKKFCPSCGNPTLLRAAVSTKAAPAGSTEPATVQVHLKANYQYRTRGTKFSIPAPKAGNAKGTNNLILREDQVEFQRGVKSEAVRARKEEKRIASALAASSNVGANGSKTWLDPDWMPDMMLGQSARRGSALPDIGYGRRNPNEVRKKKR